jgi:adenine phosphoribosyltransferase
MAHEDLKALVRGVEGFPKPGVTFRDITTLVKDPWGFPESVKRLAVLTEKVEFGTIAGIEARGFIFGAALAQHLGKGFVMIRKKDKLPGPTLGINYVLEYGVDRIEVHADAVKPGDKILLIDDLIATGGTAAAGVRLVETLGAKVTAAAFVIDLPELGGADALRRMGTQVLTLMDFPGH